MFLLICFEGVFLPVVLYDHVFNGLCGPKSISVSFTSLSICAVIQFVVSLCSGFFPSCIFLCVMVGLLRDVTQDVIILLSILYK